MILKLRNKFILCISLVIVLSIAIFPTQNLANDIPLPNIYSPAAILIDFSSGKILYEKNIYEKRYPASLTKVLTAIVVLENCEMNEVVTISESAVSAVPYGYVTANLQAGEKFTVEQLLYIFLIASANDAGIVFAEHVSGSMEDFCLLMNSKAKSIGCKSTNFTNASGIHDENHYSTAYDLALIGREAMQNEIFKKIVSTSSYKLPTSDQYTRDDRLFTTHNQLLLLNNRGRPDDYYYKYATGVKTGVTTPAGECLIATSSNDNLDFVVVTLGSGTTSDGLSERYLDAINLFEYGYDTYTMKKVSKKGQSLQTETIKNGTRDTRRLNLAVPEDVFILCKKTNLSKGLLPDIKINENLKAPIKANDVVGSVTYTSEGITYTYDLIATTDVVPSNTLRNILLIIIIGLIIYTIRYISLSKHKPNKSSKKPTTKQTGYIIK